MDRERTILLVDMNAFFASVEQACNPSLKGKPVLVGGKPGTRTIVAAASYEARAYGIHSAMSMTEAIRLCPQAIVVQGDHHKYIDVSRKNVRICLEFTDLVEVYSIDECFLDITNSMHLFGTPVDIAAEIKRRILQENGITCSVGIAPNKLLAKLASGMQKPDGLTEIRPDQITSILENLPVGKLHGIGNKMEARLERMGIRTAGELGRAPRVYMQEAFGSMGDALIDMGKGIDHSPVVAQHLHHDVKSVGHSHTLNKDTYDIEVLSKRLLKLSEMVGRRLREKEYTGRTVTLTVRYGDMQTYTHRKSLPDYLDDGYEIYNEALSILNEHLNSSRAVRLIGVTVSNLVRGTRQPGLFEDPKHREVLKVMDSINNRYGEFTIKRASIIDVNPDKKSHGFLK